MKWVRRLYFYFFPAKEEKPYTGLTLAGLKVKRFNIIDREPIIDVRRPLEMVIEELLCYEDKTWETVYIYGYYDNINLPSKYKNVVHHKVVSSWFPQDANYENIKAIAEDGRL